MLSIFVLMFVLALHVVSIEKSVDVSRFEEGRKEYSLIVRNSEMPKYGMCWKEAVASIQRGCKRLTDEVQGRLALAYLNCFLQLQGRPAYTCDPDTPIAVCTRRLEDADRGSYTTFFTQTQNICYFLQAQIWNEETESTINRLVDSSSEIASQLETHQHLQGEMIRQQNETLQNQQKIMDRTMNLSSVIASSSKYIHGMFQEFKKTTEEQRLLIDNVFTKIGKLQSLVLGEFSGFHSFIYYFLSLVIAYILTSSQRTSAARFWLFLLVTVNICLEQCIIYWGSYVLECLPAATAADENMIYWLQKLCRKGSGMVCLAVLGLFAYNYVDLQSSNNQLLQEIRKQNSELRHTLMRLLPESSRNSPETKGPVPLAPAETSVSSVTNNQAAAWAVACRPASLQEDSSSLVESESDSDGCSSILTDKTFVIQEVDQSDRDSYSTALSTASQQQALWEELQQLREATPCREMLPVATWLLSSNHTPNVSGRHSRSSTPIMSASPVASRYNLRPRSSPRVANPVVEEETPDGFARTVRQLERITRRNSLLTQSLLAPRERGSSLGT